MSFLFPFYLLGALAIAVPVLLHLRRRPTRDRIEFSSTLFLDAQVPPQRRSNRIEHWLLLALRCLALVFLALLFSRPLWRGAGDRAQMSGAVRLILLDRSASMHQTGAWDAALHAANALADEAADRDERIGFGVFDRQLEVLVPFGPARETAQAIHAATAGLRPGWTGTALYESLIAASSLLEEESRGRSVNRQLILISDFQEGASRDRLQSFAWPASVHLRAIPVVREAGTRGNASLQVVASAEEEDEDASPAQAASAPRAESIRLRVTRSGATAGALSLRWKDAPEGEALPINLPPGASRVLTAPPRPTPGSTLLELTGDAEAFDNRAFVAPRRARTVRVLFAGSTTDEASAESPLFFLSRSLGPTGTLRPEITARRVESLAAADWEQADVAVIASALPEAAAALANRFVEMGGLAVILLPDAAAASWLRHAGFAVEEAKVKDYALLEGIDFEHPVFRPFATPGLRDFSKLRTWHYRRLTTPEKESIRVLARFDSGSPALVEWAVGKGRYLIWAMSWVPGDTQLPLSSKFVPMVYATLEEAGFRHEEPVRCLAGEELPGTGPETIITLPDGTQTKGRIRAEEPGLYRLQDGESEARVVACNLPPDESRLDPLPPGSLAALGVAVEAASDGESERPGPATADAERLRGGDLEGRQKLWKWLLAGLFTVLLVETWWANRSRSSPQPQPANA